MAHLKKILPTCARICLFVLVVGSMLACSTASMILIGTPTTNPATFEAATSEMETAIAEDELATAEAIASQKASQEAEATRIVLATENAKATAGAQATATTLGTATAIARKTQQVLGALATTTAYYQAKQTSTASALAEATIQAQPMFEKIQSLYSSHYIKSTAGVFHALPDFDESWAQMDWYRIWPTGFESKDFVIQTHLTWESASSIANWFSSGCGFTFGTKDSENYFIIFMLMDGNISLNRVQNGGGMHLGSAYYGKPDLPKGEADILLIVDKNQVLFFVNDRLVLRQQQSSIPRGELAMTLLSGTNQDFGTRCQMNNTQLWELD
jgi:hypothetical protein